MTLATDPIRELFERVFCPNLEEKARREKEVLNAVSEVAGTLVPWAIAGVLGWAMISMMTGWNVGLL